MAVSFTVSTKMLPFKRLSWLWIVFQIVVVVNVNPLVSRRGEYKEYILPLYFCRRIFSARVFQRIMFPKFVKLWNFPSYDKSTFMNETVVMEVSL